MCFLWCTDWILIWLNKPRLSEADHSPASSARAENCGQTQEETKYNFTLTRNSDLFRQTGDAQVLLMSPRHSVSYRGAASQEARSQTDQKCSSRLRLTLHLHLHARTNSSDRMLWCSLLSAPKTLTTNTGTSKCINSQTFLEDYEGYVTISTLFSMLSFLEHCTN
jgi:hypothetical protein